jgi:predicted CoA-binding protein
MPLLRSDEELTELLRRVRAVAVVGASPRPSRPSHGVAEYLRSSTRWRVWFVNPTVDAILGEPSYPSLAALPEAPDLVDVFRRREHLPAVVDEAVDAGAAAVWFQLGLRDDEAAAVADRRGLEVVQDRCLEVDHRRLVGPT